MDLTRKPHYTRRMDLSPRETADLARFFARRFPRRAEVDALTRSARIALDDTLAGDDGALWSTVLVEARLQKRLRALARHAAQQEPGDQNLQEVCRILAASEPAPVLPWLLGGGVVLAVLAFGVGAWFGTRGDTAVPASELTPTVVAEVIEAAPLEIEPVPAPGVDAEPAIAPPAAPVGSAAPIAATASPPAETAAQTQVAPSAAIRCPGRPGELIGYWYVGRNAPGSQGETITLSAAANVRADYPDRHNGYDARAPLRCGLRAGDRVRLSHDPVSVPGGVYWVPLYGGDLLD